MTFGFKKVKNLLGSPEVIQKQLGDNSKPIFELNLTLKNPWNLRFLAIFVYSSGLMPFGAKVSHWMALSKAHKISKNYFLTSKMWKIVLTPPKCPRNIQGTIPELSLGSNLRNPKSMSTVRCGGHDLTFRKKSARSDRGTHFEVIILSGT